MGIGNLQMILDNTSSMHTHQGIRATTGVLAAVLAQHGVTGTKDFVTGNYGLYSAYENRGDCDFSELTDELGERFEVSNVSIKPYPTCKHTHTSIYATLNLVQENNIHPGDIEEITVRMNQAGYELVGAPLEKKQVPRIPIEAQLSIPYLLGVAVSKGDVFIDDITESAIKNPDYLAITRRVKTMVDADIDRDFRGQVGPAIVEITVRGGKKLQKRADFAIGHPKNPMSLDEVMGKYKRCLPYAAHPLDREKTDKSIELLTNLEQVSDISILPELLT